MALWIKGKERKGKERKGKERKGMERKGGKGSSSMATLKGCKTRDYQN